MNSKITKASTHISQNEGLIFEKSSPGKRAFELPPLDVPAVDPAKPDAAHQAGALAMQALAAGVRPRDVLTRPAFLNAVAAATARVMPRGRPQRHREPESPSP